MTQRCDRKLYQVEAVFDPYHKWLGIPADRRPPSAYDLLGLSPGERDPEVVDAAVVRQSAYVRNFQAGRHGDEAARILGEIAEAREVLLDPVRRQEYDATIAQQQADQRGTPSQIPNPSTTPSITPPARVGDGRRPPIRWVAARTAGLALAILVVVLAATRIVGPHRTNLTEPAAESGRGTGPSEAVPVANAPTGRPQTAGAKPLSNDTPAAPSAAPARAGEPTPPPIPATPATDLVTRGPVAPDGAPVDRKPTGTTATPPAMSTSPAMEGGLESAEGGDQDRYYDQIAAAQRELRGGDPGRARETLAPCPPTLRGWEWDYLIRQCGLARTEGRKGGDLVSEARDRAVAGLKTESHRWDEGRILRGHKAWVSSVKFSPDDRLIATSSGDGTVKVWDAATGLVLKTFDVNPGPVHGVAFSPSGSRVASAGNDALTKVWDVRSGKLLLTLRGHRLPVADVSYRGDGKRIATASMDGTIKVWDASTARILATLDAHAGTVGGVAYSPDDYRIASACDDGVVRVWDADAGKVLLELRGHSGKSEKVAYAPDGRRIASTGKDGTVRVWDAISGTELLTLRSHATQSIGVTFSPDGRRIATAGWDCVRLWDAATGREVLNLEGGQATAFSHDGHVLLSNHGQGGIEAVVRDAREGGVAATSGRPAPPDAPRRGSKATAPVVAGEPPKMTPIHRFDHPSDLLLTTLPAEVEEVVRKGKYTPSGVVGYGLAGPRPGAIQLWRHFEAGRGRHSYSLDEAATPGVLDEGMAVWVYPEARRGTVPVAGVLADGRLFYVYPQARP